MPVRVVFPAHTSLHEILMGLCKVICCGQELNVGVGGVGGAVDEVSIVYEDINVSDCV